MIVNFCFTRTYKCTCTFVYAICMCVFYSGAAVPPETKAKSLRCFSSSGFQTRTRVLLSQLPSCLSVIFASSIRRRLVASSGYGFAKFSRNQRCKSTWKFEQIASFRLAQKSPVRCGWKNLEDWCIGPERKQYS